MSDINKKTISAYIGGLILVALVGFIVDLFLSFEVQIEFLKYSVAVLYIINLSIALWRQKLPIYHPYIMFLGVFGLFILSRIFIDILGGQSFAQTTQFCHYVFDVQVQIRMLKVVFFSLVFLQIGSFVANSVSPFTSENTLSTDIDWCRIGLILFYIGLPFLVYQNIMVGLEVLEKGYGARLGGELEYRNTYLTTFMFRTSFCGFFIYLAGKPKSNFFYLHLIVFLLATYLELLEGARFRVMGLSLLMLTYVFYIRGLKFRMYYILIAVVFLVTVSAFIGSQRNQGDLKIHNEWLFSFFCEQGIGLQILGHSIEHKDDIDYSFMDMFARSNQRLDVIVHRLQGREFSYSKPELMEKYKSLPYQLTSAVNEKALKGGWDMSSSYLAEFFSIGREWGIIFGNLIVGYLTCFLYNVWKKKRIYLLLLLFCLPYWLFIPRYNTFDFVKDNITNLVFVSMVLGLIYLYKKRLFFRPLKNKT